MLFRSADPDSHTGPDWPERGPLASFPRGAGAGDCLHRILERLDLNAERGGPLGPALVERELRRAGLDSDWATSLLEGLEQMRTTPLGGPLGELRVADLAPSQRLHEMHFDLTLASVRARAIAAAFRSTPGGFVHASYAAALAQLPINHRGFLTGSIDMVFQEIGRAHV